MSTIQKIVGALVGLVMSWKPNDNIENDLADGIMLLGTASQLGGPAKVTSALIADAAKAEAFVVNLNAGQVATLPEVDYEGKKVMVFAAFSDSPVLAQLLGSNQA